MPDKSLSVQSYLFTAFRTNEDARDALIEAIDREASLEAGKYVRGLPDGLSVGEGADLLLGYIANVLRDDLVKFDPDSIDDIDVSAYLYALRLHSLLRMSHGLLREFYGKRENLDD